MTEEIRELSEEEVYSIMQSDIKLWEQATTSVEGNDVKKQVILPFGIGLVAVEFQGVDNGIKRRSAAEQWGAIIRDRVKDRIDDEAITSRAQQAAARQAAEAEDEEVGGADSGHGDQPDSTGRGAAESSEAEGPVSEAVQAHAEDDDGAQLTSTGLLARRDELARRCERVEADLARWRRELRALDAAAAVLEGGDE